VLYCVVCCVLCVCSVYYNYNIITIIHSSNA
jgi:hypothetical protein